ncbi:hypothetical protein AB0D16_18590 [Streptomyces sp. NPDC048161]|uniref:hypothetical protein n=1 Tax=Streptomyces sp. NPDC048161 TaxID=3160985 RepID=UPI0034090F33
MIVRAKAVLVSLVAAGSVLGLAGGAQSSTGQVMVFSTEQQPLNVYQGPAGCKQLPALAHELSNLTDKPVKVYGDPFCGLTVPTVPAGQVNRPNEAGQSDTLSL